MWVLIVSTTWRAMLAFFFLISVFSFSPNWLTSEWPTWPGWFTSYVCGVSLAAITEFIRLDFYACCRQARADGCVKCATEQSPKILRAPTYFSVQILGPSITPPACQAQSVPFRFEKIRKFYLVVIRTMLLTSHPKWTKHQVRACLVNM